MEFRGKEKKRVWIDSQTEEEILKEIIPESKWAKIDMEDKGEYYVVGLMYENGIGVEKDIEQAHISIAYPAPDLTEGSVEVLSVLNNILGGSMSSRLFQTVRENNGLCYSIYSYTSVLPQSGMLGIYVGLSNEMVENAQGLIEEEIDKISSQMVSEEEIKRALSQIKCSVIMSRESAASRMSANGKSMLLLGRVRTEEEILQKVMAVTQEDILNTAKKIFKSGSKALFILKAK